MTIQILIIDDDRMICESLVSLADARGYTAAHALTLKQGLEKLTDDVELVFLDVRLPDGNGIDAVPRIKSASSSPEIIIITGEGDPHGAELAIKSGVWDYIEKPLSAKKISLALKRVMQYRKERPRASRHRSIIRHGIIGDSPCLKMCIEQVGKAAEVDANVLITGRTGTGKELFARAIHANSARTTRPFVVVDCAALPENLLESMLFGHVKGAFTGADSPRGGLIKQADGGTLFLDEIGELPLSVQATFLRVLQEHRFRPVGSDREINSDFRLVAATNRDLGKAVQEGIFRSDLLYRLQSIVITMPALKERQDDILPLMQHYCAKLCDRYGLPLKAFSMEFEEMACAYDWPGNIRELVNAMEHAVSAAANEKTLLPIHFPAALRSQVVRSGMKRALNAPASSGNGHDLGQTEPERRHGGIDPSPIASLREVVEQTEREYLTKLLHHTGGHIQDVCRISGLSRANVYKKLKNLGIERKFA